MPQQELLIAVARALERAGMPYMVTGSVASSLQGEPRSTHDIDIVVEIKENGIAALAEAFPASDYYLDRDAARGAVEKGGMFNLIDRREGDKVDFWLLTGEPFDRSRFGRRVRVDFGGASLWVSAPEDTILMKLRWAQLAGGSEKQHRDALRVYEVQREAVDLGYLERWARELGVEEAWNRIIAEAKTL
jgi:hypothetical protein